VLGIKDDDEDGAIDADEDRESDEDCAGVGVQE
jgi:hypothetical protein